AELNTSASLPFDHYLISANLRGANLMGANLEQADLRGIDFSDANLSDASLKGAELDYTLDLTDWGSPNRVYRANLKGANLSNTIMPDGSTHK
ncbi:MAG: hypothetical protein F6J98_15060, partial [Moorea sp. SIO4G2]|nr:hypothetical protein [Moorena sp. SIO4G2]